MPDTLVIAYDGSRDAQRAIAAASALRADTAVVVTVWHPPLAAPTAMPLGSTLPAPGDDERLEQAARETAEEGVVRAREIGLDAEPAVMRGGSPDDVGHLLAQVASERGATAIVVGRRGISRLEAVVLGSVSNATVREAHCPVFVVPAPDE
jgi:nucleotide-binding universal stress UspA family protein